MILTFVLLVLMSAFPSWAARLAEFEQGPVLDYWTPRDSVPDTSMVLNARLLADTDTTPREQSPEPPMFVKIDDPRSLHSLPRAIHSPRKANWASKPVLLHASSPPTTRKNGEESLEGNGSSAASSHRFADSLPETPVFPGVQDHLSPQSLPLVADDASPRDQSPEPPVFVRIVDPLSIRSLPRAIGTPRKAFNPALLPALSSETEVEPLTYREVRAPELVVAYSLREDASLRKGFRAVIETIKTVQEYRPFLLEALHGHVDSFVDSQYGHRVLQELIRTCNLIDVEFVMRELNAFQYREDVGIIAVAKHRFGSSILLNILRQHVYLLRSKPEPSSSDGAKARASFDEMVSTLWSNAELLSFDEEGHLIVSELIRVQGPAHVARVQFLFTVLLRAPFSHWRAKPSGDKRCHHLAVLMSAWEHPPSSDSRELWATSVLSALRTWVTRQPSTLKAMLRDIAGKGLLLNAIHLARASKTSSNLRRSYAAMCDAFRAQSKTTAVAAFCRE